MIIGHAFYWSILFISSIRVASYNYTIVRQSVEWAKVVLDDADTVSRPVSLIGPGRSSKEMVDLPVFISLTCVSFRINSLKDTIQTILHGIVIPTHIFIFLSQESYLMDEGVKNIPPKLLEYVATGMVTIIYTENIGSHRKLLPLLQHFYNKDVIIVTIDDDLKFKANSTLLYQLLRSYRQTDGNEVIALRSRRIGLCREALGMWKNNQYFPKKINERNDTLFSEYMKWKVHYSYESSEMFVLPTGTGGVLYRPRFFHPIVFDPEFRKLTATSDDIMFRLACMARGTKVTIGCRDLRYKGRVIVSCPIDPSFMSVTPLSVNNKTADTNTKQSTSKSNTIFAMNQKRNLTGSLYDYNVHGSNDQQWRAGVAFLERAIVFDMPALVYEHGGEREDFCYFEVRSEKFCSVNSCPVNATYSVYGHVL